MTVFATPSAAPTVAAIRPAATSDYPTAAALFASTRGAGFTLSPDLWKVVCEESDAHRALIAEVGGVVVGLAVVVVSERIRLAAGTRRRRFHVDELIVSPASRRQGVGRALLEHVKAMAQAEAPSYILINCDFMNVAARRTYEAAGLHLIQQGGDRFEIAFK